MPNQDSYCNLNELAELFVAAADKNANAIDALAGALAAAPVPFAAWPAAVQDAWKKGLAPLCAKLDRPDRITDEINRLLLAMLNSGMDSKEFRKAYVMHFLYAYPRTEAQEDTLEAIGFTDGSQNVPAAALRYELYGMIRQGEARVCFEGKFGKGVVVKLEALKPKPPKGAKKGEYDDRESCRVYVMQDRLRDYGLREFLDSFALVRQGSLLDRIFNLDRGVAHFEDEASAVAALMECVKSLKPVSAEELHRAIVPVAMSQAAFEALCRPVAVRKAEDARPAGGDNERWDSSRSVPELQTRLSMLVAGKQSLALDDINVSNIRKLLRQDAGRTDAAHETLARQWLEAVAMLRGSNLFNESLLELLRELDADHAVAVWNDLDFFVAMVDKMAKTLILPWLQTTMEVRGKEFVVDATLKLPLSVWAHTEKLLGASNSHDLLVERVFQDFEDGHPSNDHYCWLWKSAIKDPRREQYLGDAYMLFKTMHLELRGNYLRSQRDLHKLLMDNENFQKILMRNGDEEAVQNLIRCIRHKPLLDASEKQSLLVKIVRSYPCFKHLVEVHNVGGHALRPSRQLTSAASFRRLQAELVDLVEVQQPRNTQAIEEARALGDLSENAEYKSAKELQRELGRRRYRMERQVESLQPTDFRQAQPGQTVIPGCLVTLQYEGAKAPEKIYLLGVLDGDVQRHFLSYESPLGQLLVSRKVGDSFTAPNGSQATILGVEALPQAVLDELA